MLNKGGNVGVKEKISAVLIAGAIVLNVPAAAFAATDEQIISSVTDAVEYLENNQNPDGSITDDVFGDTSDWSLIAIESAGIDADNVSTEGGDSLEEYIESSELDEYVATDLEKRVLAINAMGEDSSNYEGVNYNSMLAELENNGQFGEETLLNDDFFGILAAESTDDSSLIPLTGGSLSHVLAYQKDDGGFSYTTVEETCYPDWGCFANTSNSNDTAAAIMAMYAAERMGITHILLDTSRDQAIVYLLSTQNEDGGFGYDIYSVSDGSSTAWSLMALNMIGASVQAEAEAARDWLLGVQNPDGGFRFNEVCDYDLNPWCTLNSDTSTTSHAIPALLGSSWTLNPDPLSIDVITPVASPVESPSNVVAIRISSVLSNFAAVGARVGSNESSDTEQAESDDEKKTSETSQDVASDEDSAPYVGLGILGIIALVWFGWFMINSKKQEA